MNKVTVSASQTRKAYAKPALTALGSVRNLTGGSNGTKGDGGTKRTA